MRSILFWLALATMATSVAAQTSAKTQTSGSAQTDTSVSASQSGVNANSTNSATTSQDADTSGKGKRGTKSGNASASGSASNQSQAGVDTSGGAIPSGLAIPAALTKSVDSKKNKQGDEVTAKTTADVMSQGKVVIPRNSKLIGHVTEAKAKGKGESESALGIAFDRALLKNGQSIPLNATIQALAAPVAAASSTVNNDMYAGAPAPPASGSAPSGGVLGGVTGTAGSMANGAAGTVGGVANGVGDVAGNAGSTLGTTASGAGRVGGTLDAASTGVIGMKDLQLTSGASNSTNGSVITSAGKNVKLDSGVQMVLKVAASGATNNNY